MSLSATNTQSLTASQLSMLNATAQSSAASNAGTTTATGGTPSAATIQNEFLTLLTTQLQNQDPLNPMDSSQMTSQLAQISTVSGIQQLDSTMQQMMTSNSALEAAQAANLIGQPVLAPSGNVNIGATGGASMAVSLPSAASTLTVSVLDGSGNTVKTFNLGAQSGGVVPINWDGSTDQGGVAPAGSYSISTKASYAGQTVTATPLVSGQVTGVTSNSAGVSLNVAGVGSVALGSIAQIN